MKIQLCTVCYIQLPYQQVHGFCYVFQSCGFWMDTIMTTHKCLNNTDEYIILYTLFYCPQETKGENNHLILVYHSLIKKDQSEAPLSLQDRIIFLIICGTLERGKVGQDIMSVCARVYTNQPVQVNRQLFCQPEVHLQSTLATETYPFFCVYSQTHIWNYLCKYISKACVIALIQYVVLQAPDQFSPTLLVSYVRTE